MFMACILKEAGGPVRKPVGNMDFALTFLDKSLAIESSLSICRVLVPSPLWIPKCEILKSLKVA